MNRVKSLSKSGNARKDQTINSFPTINKDVPSVSALPVSVDSEDFYDQHEEVKVADSGRRPVEKENLSYNPPADYSKQPSSVSSSYSLNGREEKGVASGSMDRERHEMKHSYGDSTIQRPYPYSQNSVETEEKVQKVSPPRRKISREEKSEKLGNWLRKDPNGPDLSITSTKHQSTSNYSTNSVGPRPDLSTTSTKQQSTSNYSTNSVVPRQYESEPLPDGNINAILEVVICVVLFFHVNLFIRQ